MFASVTDLDAMAEALRRRRRDAAPGRAEPRVRRRRGPAAQRVRHLLRARGGPAGRRHAGSCWPRPTTRPASTAGTRRPPVACRPTRPAAPTRSTAGARWRWSRRPALRRPLRHGRHLPAHRAVVPDAARAARPGAVAVARRRRAAGRGVPERAVARASGSCGASAATPAAGCRWPRARRSATDPKDDAEEYADELDRRVRRARLRQRPGADPGRRPLVRHPARRTPSEVAGLSELPDAVAAQRGATGAGCGRRRP